MGEIRHIATNLAGSTFAVAEFEKAVYICDLVETKLVRTIATHLDFGGRRLAISPDGRYFAVGAYTRYGLELYEVATGVLLWKRTDLKKVQHVAFSHNGNMLIVTIANRPVHLIEAITGATTEKVRGADFIWQSSDGKAQLIERAVLRLSLADGTTFPVERSTFAVLHAVFSKDALFLSESGGPLRAISCRNGSTMWLLRPQPGFHFLRLGFNESQGLLFGIRWNYQNGGNRDLCGIDPASGSILHVTQLPESTTETEFASHGSVLVCSSGDIFELDYAPRKRSTSFAWATWRAAT